MKTSELRALGSISFIWIFFAFQLVYGSAAAELRQCTFKRKPARRLKLRRFNLNKRTVLSRSGAYLNLILWSVSSAVTVLCRLLWLLGFIPRRISFQKSIYLFFYPRKLYLFIFFFRIPTGSVKNLEAKTMHITFHLNNDYWLPLIYLM